MQQLLELKPKYELVKPGETALVPDDSIKVDTDKVGTEHSKSTKTKRFNLMVNGRVVGRLSSYSDGQWQANLREGFLRGYAECYGYGKTPDDAIRDAFTGGLNELVELVASVKRIKRDLRAKNAVVTLVEQES